MEISITDLRARTNEILWALEHNEHVRLLIRGKLKGVIKAVQSKPRVDVQDHPFFGVLKDSGTVNRPMERLRSG